MDTAIGELGLEPNGIFQLPAASADRLTVQKLIDISMGNAPASQPYEPIGLLAAISTQLEKVDEFLTGCPELSSLTVSTNHRIQEVMKRELNSVSEGLNQALLKVLAQSGDSINDSILQAAGKIISALSSIKGNLEKRQFDWHARKNAARTIHAETIERRTGIMAWAGGGILSDLAYDVFCRVLEPKSVDRTSLLRCMAASGINDLVTEADRALIAVTPLAERNGRVLFIPPNKLSAAAAQIIDRVLDLVIDSSSQSDGRRAAAAYHLAAEGLRDIGLIIKRAQRHPGMDPLQTGRALLEIGSHINEVLKGGNPVRRKEVYAYSNTDYFLTSLAGLLEEIQRDAEVHREDLGTNEQSQRL